MIGYCWGGYVAWMAAARLAGFACAIPYYGGGMLEAIGEQPRCPVMAHFGERDTGIPVAGVRKLAAAHPGSAGVHLRGRPRVQLRSAGGLRRGGGEARARATLEFLRRHVG